MKEEIKLSIFYFLFIPCVLGKSSRISLLILHNPLEQLSHCINNTVLYLSKYSSPSEDYKLLAEINKYSQHTVVRKLNDGIWIHNNSKGSIIVSDIQ